MRRGADANDPATLREVARQFESIFTKMMLDSMRSASFGDPMFGSDQVDMYQDMADDQLAVQLSQGRGLGLADMLIRQLGQGGVGAAAAVPGKTDEKTTGGVTPAQQRKFVDEMLPHATAAARELGVDARAIVAQAALETGWGTSQPADAGGGSHNILSASRPAPAGRARASPPIPPNSSPDRPAPNAPGFAPTVLSRKTSRIMFAYFGTTRATPRHSAPAPTCAPSPMPCSAAAMPRIRSTPTNSWPPSKQIAGRQSAAAAAPCKCERVQVR